MNKKIIAFIFVISFSNNALFSNNIDSENFDFQQSNAYPNGVPHAIPGTINATNFDTGGEGVSYHDTTPLNSGPGPREGEGVDTENRDIGGNVGWIIANEWLIFTVNVQTAGTYNITFSVADETPSPVSSFHLEFGGNNVTGPVNIPTTGGWDNFITIQADGINLDAGVQTMRLFFDAGSFNISNMVFSLIEEENEVPTVTITNPLNNSNIAVGTMVQVTADASDTDGSVSQVEFFADGVSLGVDTTSPYAWDWNPTAGSYSLTAVATDDDGATTTSSAILVSINELAEAQSAYPNGVPHAIPGTINATNFDTGGEGVAYHDTTPLNSGPGPRGSEGVDTENRDIGGNVGWIIANEWLIFTVNVQTAGTYNITFSVADQTSSPVSSFHLEFGGTNVTGPVNIPTTGGWDNFITIQADDINLDAGVQTMRLFFDAGSFNISNMVFSLIEEENEVPTVAITNPLNNSNTTVGTIVQVMADASDTDGTVSQVEFFADGVSLGVDTTSPYSWDWNPTAGSYSLTAVATDDDGATTTSSAILTTIDEANTAPTVAITNPLNNSNTTVGTIVQVTADASDADGTVSQVEFFADGVSLGVDTTSPYSWDWNPTAGSYSLTAVATDDDGATTTASAILVSIDELAVAPSAYPDGVPHAIPGTINATNFDTGGEGVAYHDTTPANAGTGPRGDEGVDTENRDIGGNVGWVIANEWLIFTVNVQTTGSYNIDFSVADATPSPVSSFHLEFNGNNVTGSINTPSTGSWDIFQTIQVTDVQLNAGIQTMRLYFEERSLNISNIVFSLNEEENEVPTVAITSPLNNSNAAVGTPVQITADASDTDGTVNQVEFFADGVSLGVDTTSPYSWDWNPTAGSYSLTAVATDDDGATTTSSAILTTIDEANTAPTVAITNPLNNSNTTVGTMVQVTADASDTEGTVSQVEFFADGVSLGVDTTSPYSWDWNPTAGSYSLTAVATDDDGATTTSSTISVVINSTLTYYRDLDTDTYGDPNDSVLAAEQPVGYVLDNTDCDDSDANINPNTLWYEDKDGDGLGDPASTPIVTCEQPTGYINNNNDDDDSIDYARIYLIDANTDTVIRELFNGETINMDDVGSDLNIQVIPELSIGSIVFTSDDGFTSTTSNPPYAYRGGIGEDFNVWNPSLGDIAITIDYYSEASGEGNLLSNEVLNLTFTGTSIDIGLFINTVLLPNSVFEIVNGDETIQNLQTGQEDSEVFVAFSDTNINEEILINVLEDQNNDKLNLRISKENNLLSVDIFDEGTWLDFSSKFYRIEDNKIFFVPGNKPIIPVPFSINLVNGVEYDKSSELILEIIDDIDVTGSTLELTGPDNLSLTISPDLAQNNFIWDGRSTGSGLYKFQLQIQGEFFTGQFIVKQ